MKLIKVVIAGSTQRTAQCADSLQSDPRFEISAILTPSPKLQGRKQELTPNPLHQFGITHSIPVQLIDKKINETIREHLITRHEQPDILLVVDFGYLIPGWLLDWPKVAPVNVHPSDLPKFRGSSPGQFTLLFGEETGTVSFIKMDEKLDHGPIIDKIEFEIEPLWTAQNYYEHAFALAAKELGTVLFQIYTHPKEITPQSDLSPTPTARMLNRQDGFVPLEILLWALKNTSTRSLQPKSIPILDSYSLTTNNQKLFDLWRALTPWPGLWTMIHRGDKDLRVKLLKMSLTKNQLKLDQIQFEGKKPQDYKPEMLN